MDLNIGDKRDLINHPFYGTMVCNPVKLVDISENEWQTHPYLLVDAKDRVIRLNKEGLEYLRRINVNQA